MLGVSLGVMVLIVALSVINGSINSLRNEALKSVPHVTIAGESLESNWERQAVNAQLSDQVLAAAPFLEGEAVLRYQGKNIFIRVRGVDPQREAEIVNNESQSFSNLLDILQERNNSIILGTQLASQLGISSGNELSVTSLNSLLTRSLSDAQGFEVTGFADFGIYGNQAIALINLNEARELFAQDRGVNLQLRLRVSDIFNAELIAMDLFENAGNLDIQSWNETQATLFNALNMEKLLTSFMLLMIVVIGAVNIISTLVMVVSDKTSDVAILRTMGASRSIIMKIFVVQGLIVGIVGTTIGALLGLLLANNITKLSLWLEQLINLVFADANIYLISHLQTRVNVSEVMLVCLIALLICFLATLYPAFRASKIQPAEALRSG
tara:strand:+ start:731 stop:1876 length:1146 start_codon:yes stop_codon:yes gene_type:complete